MNRSKSASSPFFRRRAHSRVAEAGVAAGSPYALLLLLLPCC